MLLPLGILASASGGADYELISTTVVSGTSTSTVTFTNGGAWNSYKHLQLRVVSRGGRAGTDDDFFMRFNGDTANNYSRHHLSSYAAASPSGYNVPSAPSMYIGSPTGNSATANIFGAQIVDILDPFSTTKNKTIRSLAGSTGVNYIQFISGAWYNSASAVTSIDIYPYTTIFAGSRFSLYGLKG